MGGGGNPAFEGTKPPSASGTESQLDAHGIKPGQNGVNAKTAHNFTGDARNSHAQAEVSHWVKTKDKLTYGMSLNAEIVLGLKTTIVAGVKTAIDAAFNRTHNLSSFTTLFGGIRYEIIRGTKTETVTGSKQDVAALGRKLEWSNGAWTHSESSIKKMRQKDFDAMCKSLAEEFGNKLNETTNSHTARITKFEEHVKTETDKMTTSLAVTANSLRASLDQMKRELDQLDIIAGEFTRKMADMDAAADAALKIRTPSSKIKGSMIEIKGSVQKFMGSLVKLGE